MILLTILAISFTYFLNQIICRKALQKDTVVEWKWNARTIKSKLSKEISQMY